MDTEKEDWVAVMWQRAEFDGLVTGWLDAMALVSDVVAELYDTGTPENHALATQIHTLIWQRLRELRPRHKS